MVPIQDTKICSVAGVITAGADCHTTISDKPSEMTMQEFLYFLLPDPAKNKSGAICQSSEDYVAIKTSLEQACYLLKGRCTKEHKKMIENLGKAIKDVGGK